MRNLKSHEVRCDTSWDNAREGKFLIQSVSREIHYSKWEK